MHNRHMTIIGYGFIGRRIGREAVRRGWRVSAINLEEVADDTVEVIVGSAQEPGILARAMTGSDHVVFAAGTTKPAESDLDPVVDAVRNLEPLIAVLNAARTHGVGGFTFLSSGGTVYGPAAPVPTLEDVPLWPISSYGILKVAAERYVAMYARQGGFSADLLRCANVFGPGEPTTGSQGLIGIARANLLAGKPIVIFGDGSARRDYIHVDDLASVVVQLAERPNGARVLNVGSGRATSVMEIVGALSQALGVEPVLDHRPARSSDSPIAQLDISRLQAILDFHPHPTEAWLAAPIEALSL